MRGRLSVGDARGRIPFVYRPIRTAADGDQEGTPVSLMEAQSCGLPVVSTLHSGIPEVVLDGVTGFVVPERDVEALADRIARLVADGQLAAAMGRAGRACVERAYDLRVLNRDLVPLYEDVAGAHRRGATQA